MHTRIYSHIWGHIWAPWEQQWGSNGACMRAYMAIYGGSNGACMRAYMAIYGSSNGACARVYIGHVWGSPIGRAGKGFPVILFPSLLRGRELPSLRSLPFPSPVPFPGRGREEIPCSIPQRIFSYFFSYFINTTVGVRINKSLI